MTDMISGGDKAAVETNTNTDDWDDGIVDIGHKEQVQPEPKAEPEDHEESTEEDDHEEKQELPKKKPKGFVKKLNIAEERLSAAERRNLELQAQLDTLQGKSNPAKPQEQKAADLKEPQLSDYTDLGSYLKDAREYDRQMAVKEAESRLNETLSKRDKESQEKQQQEVVNQQYQVSVNKYLSELETYEAENPGTDAKLQAMVDEEGVPPELVQLVVGGTKNPVQVSEYFADNRASVRSIIKLAKSDPIAALVEVARIDGMVSGSTSPSESKRETQAKPPIKPINGSKARTNSGYRPDMTDREYEEWESEVKPRR